MEGVKFDKSGYEVKTSSDSCIFAINAYYHQVLSYGRDRRVILEAPVHDKDCVLANILAAHFLFSSDPSEASLHIEAAKSRLEQATFYEKAVFDVVNYLISENRDDDVAVELHSKLLRDFPRDLVSLKRVQVLCFYMGRPDLSLGLVQQVLPQNQQENYIYGMLAFPLLELGRMADAESAAEKGFEINKQDFWAQHALCHVLQYECRYKEAVQFMEECSSSWGSCSSFMLTHNWWHVALCYLEGHSPIIKVREIYDHCIWKELERSDAICAEVYLNALGLLLRVHVRGELDFFEDRLKILAAHLTDQANWFMEWHFDVLILWALAFTGEVAKAEDLLKGLKSRLERFSMMSKKKQQVMQRAMLLAEAIYEYGQGNEKQALEILGPDFDAYNCKIIGASDEQLDVFSEVWYSMLLNTGQVTKAIESIEKQIQKREGAPFLWRLLETGYTLSGRQEAATIGEKARVLEAAYFN
ncbi:Tetratricopeptide repeat (TPR)-like superfamily protein isoform 2 [Theobroma cacao]|uniref:Tetratricopeptide repeat protein 38 n=1 Tax=Theobroma cacao TaxID=3641 RepID=A0A061E5F6_THECC|nr:Tetratricopeptide repeat (TPR)-like superfamily protein isoform 2 [Theobroma cacao]